MEKVIKGKWKSGQRRKVGTNKGEEGTGNLKKLYMFGRGKGRKQHQAMRRMSVDKEEGNVYVCEGLLKVEKEGGGCKEEERK